MVLGTTDDKSTAKRLDNSQHGLHSNPWFGKDIMHVGGQFYLQQYDGDVDITLSGRLIKVSRELNLPGIKLQF